MYRTKAMSCKLQKMSSKPLINVRSMCNYEVKFCQTVSLLMSAIEGRGQPLVVLQPKNNKHRNGTTLISLSLCSCGNHVFDHPLDLLTSSAFFISILRSPQGCDDKWSSLFSSCNRFGTYLHYQSHYLSFIMLF